MLDHLREEEQQKAENFEHFGKYIINSVSVVNENECADEARRCHSSILARNGTKSSLSDREAMMFEVPGNTREQYAMMERTADAKY